MARVVPTFRVWLALSVCLATLVSAQDNEDPNWSASIGSKFLNRYTAYGIDLGNDRSAASYSVSLGHVSGFSVGIGAIQVLESPAEIQNWSMDVGYDWAATEWLSLSAGYSHYSYVNDSANVLSQLVNSISVGADVDLGAVSVGFSYDTYLGTNSASYISLDASSYIGVGRLAVVPLAQATIMSQTVESRLLKPQKGSSSSGRGGSSGSQTATSSDLTTLTGLSGVSLHVVLIYRLLDGLNVSFHPYYLYSPKSELSTSDSDIVWSAGVRYSYDF